MSSRFPAAFRPPALACGIVLLPLGSWAFLTVGLPDTILLLSGPHRGCHVLHERDTTGLGAPCTPRRRCSSGWLDVANQRLSLPSDQS
jgi:hypothetical protein